MVSEWFICAVFVRIRTRTSDVIGQLVRGKLIEELSRTINGRSVIRLVGRSFGRSVDPRSVGRSEVVRSFVRSFGRSFVRSFGSSFSRSFGRSFNPSIGRSFGRLFGR